VLLGNSSDVLKDCGAFEDRGGRILLNIDDYLCSDTV
jgi:hypothetical protein